MCGLTLAAGSSNWPGFKGAVAFADALTALTALQSLDVRYTVLCKDKNEREEVEVEGVNTIYHPPNQIAFSMHMHDGGYVSVGESENV